MPYGMYISAEGAFAQSERLKVIANNMANVDTAGFKRDIAVFQARFCEAVEQGLVPPGSGTVDDLSGGVLAVGTLTDFAPGRLKLTGRDTDMAIDGHGYFQIQRGKQTFLTRAGNFLLNAAGALVTQNGDPVLDQAGRPIIIDPEVGPWSIAPDGTIQQAGDIIPIGLMEPRHASDLVKVGDNLFLPLSRPLPVPIEARRVVTGHLEMSGVEPTSEMIELIEASRGFEANANMIRNQDQILGTLIGRVLKA